MNVLVINQCAHNKGDRAVLYCVLRELARNGVSKVWVSSSGPGLEQISDYRIPAQVEFIPVAWPLPHAGGGNRLTRKLSYLATQRHIDAQFGKIDRLARANKTTDAGALGVNSSFAAALEQCDFVLSTGGHHLTSLLHPNVRCEQLYEMCASLAAGKKLVFWSQSFGPFDFTKDLYKRLVGWVLSSATAIYVRDQQSLQQIADAGGCTSSVRETYESVFALNDLISDYVMPSQRGNVVGLSIYHAERRSEPEHASYVAAMARIVDHIVETGHVPRFFPMEPKKQHDDRELIREILSRARLGQESFLLDDDMEPSAHVREVAKCKLYIGHKTHSVIFALATGTPLVAIAYHKKTEDFMRDYGLSDYCVWGKAMDGDVLVDKFSGVLAQCDEIGLKSFERSRKLTQQVRADFGAMVAKMLEGKG